MTRRLYIDWLRGIAVLFMIMWHTMDSWTVLDGRDSFSFTLIRFAAGWVSPLFLFLAGVSVPLAAAARMARCGEDRLAASRALQRRGWQVFVLAHLFRFQSFLLNPNGSWSGLMKPDILNVLGLGIVAAAFCWGRASGSPRSLVAWLVVPALILVAILTPWAKHWWWPTLLHPRLEAYFRPVGNYGVFTLFPTMAYVFAGTYLGAMLAGRREHSEAVTHRRMAIGGLVLVACGIVFSRTPWSLTPRWTDLMSLFLCRTGVMAMLMAGAWALFRRRSLERANPLVVFGQTSLFVYWIHVELAYGVFSYPIRHALALPWAFAAFLTLTWLMLIGARFWMRRPAPGTWIPQHMKAA